VAVDYKRAAKVDDLLQIRTRYLGLDGPRFIFQQACLRDGELIAQADITAVMIHADGRPRRPVREMMDTLADYIWTEPTG
jgi:acyl-CoA thioester hydrolase